MAKESRRKQLQKEKYTKAILKQIGNTFALWLAIIAFTRLPFWDEAINKAVVSFTTYTIYLLGSLFFLPIELVSNQMIAISEFHLHIIPECTAFSVLVFIFPLVYFSDWEKSSKIKNVLLIFGIVFFINIARLLILGVLGDSFPEAFDIAHDYLWNIGFILVVFGLWLWKDNVAQRQIKENEVSV